VTDLAPDTRVARPDQVSADAGAAQPDVSYARIVRVAAPMMLSTLTGVGSQLVVMALIGRMGESALYVRSVYAPIAYLFLAATTGLSVTLQVAVAQAHGRGQDASISGQAGSVARAGVVLYLLLGGALVAGAGLLGDAVRIAPGHSAEFHEFLLAMAGATLVGMLGELSSSVLRGLGRTGVAAIITASYVALYLAIIGVVGVVLHGGLMAVPLAAALAGVVEVIAGLFLLIRGGVVRPAGLAGWQPRIPRQLVAIGLPVCTTLIVLCVVNLVLLRIVAPGGQFAVAGFTIGYTVQSAVITPAIGLGSAIGILMNHHVAAGSVRAARSVFRRGMLLGACTYLVAGILAPVLGGPLSGLLSGNPEIAAQARHFLDVVGPSFACTGVILTALTVLEQVGYAAFATKLNAGYFAVILAVGWIAADATHRIDGLYWTLAIGPVCSLATGLPWAWRAALKPRAPHHEPAGGTP
jgi:Na+-driven multidrug efflux pump